MNEFKLKTRIKKLIITFHSTPLPEIINREIDLPDFKKINKVFVVIGPRRAGKTFVLYQAMKKLIESGHSLKEFIYLNFENENLVELKAN